MVEPLSRWVRIFAPRVGSGVRGQEPDELAAVFTGMRVLIAVVPVVVACSSQLEAASPTEPPVGECAYVQKIGDEPWPLEQGLREWFGDGVPRDPARAKGTLGDACDQGTSAACTALAILGQKDTLALLERGSQDLFDLGGCEEISPSKSQGIGRGSTWCCRGARGCPSGCDAECARTAVKIRTRTVDVIERGCQRGDVRACHLAALQYNFGTYFEPVGYVLEADPDRAKRLFARACDGGVARACTHVGRLQRACDLGDGYGCLELSRVGAGDVKALQVRACKLGMELVCEELARP
jgi:TPR repeat protein